MERMRRGMPVLASESDNEIDRYVMKKLRKIQAEGFEIPGLGSASDNEIDDYVMKKLRKIQGEGFEMPGLATASESDILSLRDGESARHY